MFFLCLIKMKIKSNSEKTLNSKGKEKIREKTKKEKTLTNEAKDTILKIKNTTTQAKIAIKKSNNKEEN